MREIHRPRTLEEACSDIANAYQECADTTGEEYEQARLRLIKACGRMIPILARREAEERAPKAEVSGD